MAKLENLKFYYCKHCGNIIQVVQTKGVPIICCGEPMEELKPNTTDASHEKHVPVVAVQEDTLKAFIGTAEHPMVEEHFIEWIYLETDKGIYRKLLKPGVAPSAEFPLCCEKPVAVYAYCNIHGLWKTDV